MVKQDSVSHSLPTIAHNDEVKPPLNAQANHVQNKMSRTPLLVYCHYAIIWRSLKKCGTERNGTEWKMLIKHGTELLSRHKVHLRTHGPRSYTHANCSYTGARRERLADRFAHSFSWKRLRSRLHHTSAYGTRTKRACNSSVQWWWWQCNFSAAMHYMLLPSRRLFIYSSNLQLRNLTSYYIPCMQRYLALILLQIILGSLCSLRTIAWVQLYHQ